MRVLILALAMVVLQVGCGGGSGGGNAPASGPAGVPAPSHLTVMEGPGANQLTLQWNLSAGSVRGYIVEAKVGTGSYLDLNDINNLIPPSTSFIELSFSSTAPELTTYGFRMKAVQGTSTSDPSNEITYQRSLATPTGVSAAFDYTLGGVALSWQSNSVLADGSRVERAPCDSGGTVNGIWSDLSVPSGLRVTFLDLNSEEGATYVYRVSNSRGGIPGLPSTSSPKAIVPMIAPYNVQVATVTGGLQISWTNRSASATQIAIRRFPFGGSYPEIALLNPTTTHYQDLNIEAGYYSYSVVAIKDSDSAASPEVPGIAPQTTGSLQLSTRVHNYQEYLHGWLRPQGSWAFMSESPLGILTFGDPWSAYFPGTQPSNKPRFQCDTQNWPHLSYLTYDPLSDQAGLIFHHWYDGGAWQSDSMNTTKPMKGDSICMDSNGGVHILKIRPSAEYPDGQATANLSYIHKSAGQWVTENLSSLSPALDFSFGSCHFDVGSTGTPHVLIGTGSTIHEYAPLTPGGTWLYTTIPTGSVRAGYYDYLDGFWSDPSNGWVIFERALSGDPSGDLALVAIQKVAGSWRTPIVLGNRYHDGRSTEARLYYSTDRSRMAVASRTSTGLKIFVNSGMGWHATLLGTNQYALPDVGFDSHNRIYILAWDQIQHTYTEWHE